MSEATTKSKTRARSRAAHVTRLDGLGTAPAQVPADISTTAWAPRGELSHGQWAAAGRRLGTIGRASQWWIADWLRYGTARWGEKYAEASRLTGYDPASLRNMVWVASQFDDLSLRNDKLTWSHHVLVAALEPGEKREWLERATEERLTVADLRSELRAAGAAKGGGSEPEASQEPDSAGEPHAVVCPKCGHRLEG